MAFKIAGSMAFKAAIAKADPVLLEPIMKVDVTVPEEYMGDVIGDLNSRRGRIEGMDAQRHDRRDSRAGSALRDVRLLPPTLRSRTQGRGVYTMQPEHYEPVPKSIAGEGLRRQDGEVSLLGFPFSVREAISRIIICQVLA